MAQIMFECWVFLFRKLEHRFQRPGERIFKEDIVYSNCLAQKLTCIMNPRDNCRNTCFDKRIAHRGFGWTNCATCARGYLLNNKQVITRSATMFYLIGLGLYDEKDITFRGLEVFTTTLYLYLLARIITLTKGRS